MERKRAGDGSECSPDTYGGMTDDPIKNAVPEGTAGSDIAGNETDMQALRERRYCLLVENISDAVWTLDLNSLRFTYVSPSVERLLGYSAEEMIAQGLKRILTPAFFRVAMKVLEEELALEKEEGKDLLRSRTIELDLVRKDGTAVCTETRATLLRDPNDKPVGILGVTRDISERKKTEKARRLAQLSKFIFNIAHELNNPLMVISGRAQLSLMEGENEEEIKSNLQLIFEQALRAKSIIQKLFRFASSAKGETSNVDLNVSMEELLNRIESRFRSSGVEIKRKYALDLPSIIIDEKRIQEVFINLLNNACDAMSGNGTIEITTSRENNFLRVDVKDTGSGMTRKIMDKALNPFFTTKEKATGLGLSVSYSVIKAYKGELKFESYPGKGTTATVLLPIMEVRNNG